MACKYEREFSSIHSRIRRGWYMTILCLSFLYRNHRSVHLTLYHLSFQLKGRWMTHFISFSSEGVGLEGESPFHVIFRDYNTVTEIWHLIVRHKWSSKLRWSDEADIKSEWEDWLTHWFTQLNHNSLSKRGVWCRRWNEWAHCMWTTQKGCHWREYHEGKNMKLDTQERAIDCSSSSRILAASIHSLVRQFCAGGYGHKKISFKYCSPGHSLYRGWRWRTRSETEKEMKHFLCEHRQY